VIAVIADDFTGAAELAGAAAELGLAAEVQTRFDPSSDAQVIALDTDTRALEESAAARIVGDATRDIQRANPDWIYKKTDSVLRGNVRAEIEAILASTGQRRCLLVPANPSKGRTIRGGSYFIDGMPLAQTAFANDPEHPRRSSRIVDLLGGSITSVGYLESAPADGIVVPDVQSESDLMVRAAERDGSVLPAGGVEFFTAIVRSKGMNRASESSPQSVIPSVRQRLFVCGSAQAWSHGRADECRRHGVTVHAMPDEILSALNDPPDGARNRFAAMIAKTLETEGAAMASIGREYDPTCASTNRFAEWLVEAVVGVLMRRSCEQVYLEGGATAAALARKMHWTRFSAVATQLAGVACLRPVGRESPMLFVKPGSYPWPREVWPV